MHWFVTKSNSRNIDKFSFNPFAPNAPFLSPLKTSENRKVFLCFQGVEKGCIGTNGFTEVPGLKSSGCNATKIKPLTKFLKGISKAEKWKILEMSRTYSVNLTLALTQ